MAAREIFPVQFATRRVGHTGAEITTYTNNNPYAAERDADPKASPAPVSAESSQPEAREITPVQGMHNSPVEDLPPITKVRAGSDPNATYGEAESLPKAVPVEGEPETALEKRAEDPTDPAVQEIPIEKVETALSVEEQTAAVLAATERGQDPAEELSAEEKRKRQSQENLAKARAAKAAKQGKGSPSDAPATSASAAKGAETDEDGLVF